MSAVQNALAALHANQKNHATEGAPEEKWRELLESYWTEHERIEAQFKADLIQEESSSSNPDLNSFLYEQATETGLPSDYESVHQRFVHFVKMADQIRSFD